MPHELLIALAVLGPLLFGLAMGLLAEWLFDLAASKLPFKELLGVFFQVLIWLFGNGAVVMGGTYLASLTASLEGLPGGVAAVLLSYLAGFGIGILSRFALPSGDRSLLSALRNYLSGQQIEAVLLMLRYRETDISTAASKMGVSHEDFVGIYEEALRIIRKRWNRLKGLLQEVSHDQTTGSATAPSPGQVTGSPSSQPPVPGP